MAGKATSDSRMGVTLQGLDQVIALSQANINDALEYHFTAKPELCQMDLSLRTPTREQLKGVLKPPTIELVDAENADRALYCLEFKSGDYSFLDIEDEEELPKRKKMPCKGWRFAFYVDFAMQKWQNVPEKIRNMINLPGSYSVDQLLVDFGTADIMTFNWDRSRITGFPSEDGESAAKDTMTLFVNKWLTSLKTKNESGSHNILGSAVKMVAGNENEMREVLNRVPHSTPSFPPTAVRLQTINHRPDGDAGKASTDNEHNAFLFTEMTELRPLPAGDLQWSGDWFYDSIGGTLAMSRRIFWDRYIAVAMAEINQKALHAANKIAKEMSLNIMPQEWLLADTDKNNQGQWTSYNGLMNKFDCKNEKSTYHEPEVTGPNPQFDFNVKYDIQTAMRPVPGESKIEIATGIAIEGKQNVTISFFPGFISGVDIHSKAFAISTTTITFHSVESTGDLRVDINTEQSQVQAIAGITQTSFLMKIPGIGSVLDGALRDLLDINKFQGYVQDAVKEAAGETLHDNSAIERALNGQGRFVFPGGGTFNMKDPIFNRAGDLMIGLTYVKGDAATEE